MGKFNERRDEVITAGEYIIIDECMCNWRGAEQFLKDPNSVHVTKIQRKPKGVGFELKSSADGYSGILLRIEMQEGKLVKEPKEYEREPDKIPFHAAIVLRLLSKSYHGTGRIIVGDAAFGSLTTCTELYRRGLYFLGVIKTACSGFPKKFFEAWGKGENGNAKPTRGDCKVLRTTIGTGNNTTEVTALGWYAKDGMVKQFIGSTSVTTAGTPLKVPRTKLSVDENGVITTKTIYRETPRPKLVEDLFKYFGAIDHHDRYRQGYLAMERSWGTKCWWHRVFCTLYGMCLTDAYLAYCMDNKDANGAGNDDENKMQYIEFLGHLAHGLIFAEANDKAMQLRDRNVDNTAANIAEQVKNK